jgi:lysophospholipase L1-like esterase
LSGWRKFAWIALLAGVVLLVLALRPGHNGSAAEAKGAGALAHPHTVDAARRQTAAVHARALLALELTKVPADSHWLASWGAAPQAASSDNTFSLGGFANQTVREIVMLSSDGAAIRIHLSNLYGNRPLVIAQASVAVAGSWGTLISTPQEVSFGGLDYVTIRPGGSVVSDPIALKVHALERLAVSLYLPQLTGRLTYHGTSEQEAFLGDGDDVLNPSADWTTDTSPSWYLLTGVDTLSPKRFIGTVAAFGDSITAGYHSTLNTFGAWPDDLARRLARISGQTLAVVDEGISGNRILNPSPCCGPAALTRFPADVLEQAGVRDVILLEGVNDIGYSQDTTALTAPHTNVTAAQIIAGYERIIAAAHAAGLRIYGATLLPFKGAPYWTPAGEAKREAVNNWILTSGAFNGVINFAAVMAEPGHPQVLNPAYDSGDQLHPNNAGYAAMARAIQLSMLTSTGAVISTAATTHHGAGASAHAVKTARRGSARAHSSTTLN